MAGHERALGALPAVTSGCHIPAPYPGMMPAGPGRECDTATVISDSNFWVATSAAAPVIALAAIVALPDAAAAVGKSSEYLNELHRLWPQPDRSARIVILLNRIFRWWRMLVWALTAANLLAQAALLAVSLSALAYGRDTIPPSAAIALAVGGIVLLAWTASASASIKRQKSAAPGGKTAVSDSGAAGAAGAAAEPQNDSASAGDSHD